MEFRMSISTICLLILLLQYSLSNPLIEDINNISKVDSTDNKQTNTILNDELHSQVRRLSAYKKNRARPHVLTYDIILHQWALRHPNQQ